MSHRVKIEGKRYGRLLVLDYIGSNARGVAVYRCICDCGAERIISGGHLRSGHSQACGCVKPGLRLRPYEAIFNTLRRSAKRSQKEITLTYEDFLAFTSIMHCHYCGQQIIWNKHNARSSIYNLDRVDNTQGYVKNNLVVCCKRCNYAKADRFTYDEWTQIGKLIKSWGVNEQG
jgi:hypothetical protein